MSQALKKKHSDWNGPLLIMIGLFYGGLLILFGFQTWWFLDWLFPSYQLLMKILTLVSFDVLALVWAIVHTFYRFRSRNAKRWTVIAWIITFILSLVASVFYLIVQSYFRFELKVDESAVQFGYGVSIIALVFNILALMFVLIGEFRAAHPRMDYFDEEEVLDYAHRDKNGGFFLEPKVLDPPSPDMQKWFSMYRDSGDAAVMNFPDWVKRMELATKKNGKH